VLLSHDNYIPKIILSIFADYFYMVIVFAGSGFVFVGSGFVFVALGAGMVGAGFWRHPLTDYSLHKLGTIYGWL